MWKQWFNWRIANKQPFVDAFLDEMPNWAAELKIITFLTSISLLVFIFCCCCCCSFFCCYLFILLIIGIFQAHEHKHSHRQTPSRQHHACSASKTEKLPKLCFRLQSRQLAWARKSALMHATQQRKNTRNKYTGKYLKQGNSIWLCVHRVL